LCFFSLYIFCTTCIIFEYLHDVIYEAESALCNINKHHLQLKDRQLDEAGEILKTEDFSMALIASCPSGSALRAAAAGGAGEPNSLRVPIDLIFFHLIKGTNINEQEKQPAIRN
jgi:hypothetical protein